MKFLKFKIIVDVNQWLSGHKTDFSSDTSSDVCKMDNCDNEIDKINKKKKSDFLYPIQWFEMILWKWFDK
jgi:hypothetical protein